MKRVFIMLAFLAAAMVCYGIGFHFGALLIVGAGMFFEGLFWLKLIGRERSTRSRETTT